MINEPYNFRPPVTESDWLAYDAIRRTVLFEARGRFNVYQARHPDEFAPGHFPHLLYREGVPIGVVRIDLPADSREGIIRLVAIALDSQRQGHGARIMAEAENFAKGRGRTLLVVNAAPDAVPFYEKLGYRHDPDGPREHPDCPRLVKEASAP